MEIKIFHYAVLFFLFWPSLSDAQEKFDFYVSNKGDDGNPGTSESLAKKTIAGIAPLLKKVYVANGSVKVGLQSGDTWEENLITSYPIQLNTYSNNLNQKNLAILNGSKEFNTGWVKLPGTVNTFKQDIPYDGFAGYGINAIGSYSYIYVLEIDKELEKSAPFTARKLLKFVSSLKDLENNPGSFYIAVTTDQNPIPVFIHTTDGNSPNASIKFRYEVTVRDWAVNSTYQHNNRFENLWVRGFGAGNGMLPGGDNSYYNKIIFGPGAAIHHIVLRSGTINHSLFLPGPKNTNAFAVVFYDVEGLGRHCTVKNSMFFDIRSPVYAHTSLGTNFGAVELDNVVGFADITETAGFMYTANTDSVILNNVYAEGYTSGYNYGNAKYASISNSWFKDVTFGIGYSSKNPVQSTVKNVFIKTRGADNVNGIILGNNTSLTLTNSIVHIVSNNKNAGGSRVGNFVYGSGSIENKIDASGNIFICDIDPANSLTAAVTNTSNGVASSKDKWNNNVYILLKGNRISWGMVNTSANGGNHTIQDFEEWKRQSGQDKQSLFFDLRHDPRGLKAIFTDPHNGNYDLANTPEGKQIAALHAGMTTPITCFLQKPTYEEAAGLIMNNKVLSVNGCRNPCQQNTVRINSTFDISALNGRQIKLQWNISEQQNIDRYEIQRSTEYLIFNRIISLPASVDSTYAFIDNVEPGINYRYRLVIVPKADGKCYSDIRTLKLNDKKYLTIYPNPSNGKILISLNRYVGSIKFIVSNMIGQTILVKEGFSLYSPLELDLSNQPKGNYLLKVETLNGTDIQKFSLQ